MTGSHRTLTIDVKPSVPQQRQTPRHAAQSDMARGLRPRAESNRSRSGNIPPFLSFFSVCSLGVAVAAGEASTDRRDWEKLPGKVPRLSSKPESGSNVSWLVCSRCRTRCPENGSDRAGHDVQHLAPTVPASRAADNAVPLIVFDPISGFEDNRDVPGALDRGCRQVSTVSNAAESLAPSATPLQTAGCQALTLTAVL
jgi:hypothetical protein